MLYRGYLSLVDRLPLPSLRAQRIIAFLTILTQGGIAVTGSVVRVTASGLGCPTWPQCFPGSLVPVGVSSNVHTLHQVVEFGNRLLTFVVVAVAAAIVLAVTRARRRKEVIAWAWLMPAGTVVQAILGGITVLAGLVWWTVAIHMLASMLMVWLAVILYAKVGEPDDGIVVQVLPQPLRWLTALSAVALAGVLVLGTMVTGAGPHAGDKSIDNPVPRLDLDITMLVHLHAEALVGYLALLVGLAFAVYALHAPEAVKTRLKVVLALVAAQACIGLVQFWTDVPAVLVVLHVAGAGLCTAATAAVWAAGRIRTTAPVPEPVTV
ncbi:MULTISPECIES: COX15/CtaA family protein [unclassified Rhodococcus (in: high G+C Gram-positive bacteria)]|uniref:COX15/CtaA family protein n=1 Tax=unclassified Rhodococcus (in: high G+C Gram-positive bacteria) TaxID=192944 RepID=UPI00146B5357|nr:heme A synthase [Rhodococcus sp. (in: high G+C Gram-positive bacteria)]MBF0662501.1 heme A synthase [Rhodococcus sp. (in: high G+C Gram-positive bacteria)]NMD96582.1 heme A synthase [Rhodococcus sp. BL-253-APC-6A1W]NME79280.1 heme A synthase [Rhodococcus sp. 105337]